MTLVIGIKCREGIVLASDSAATQGTIWQPNQKIKIYDMQLVTGIAGGLAMSQCVQDVLEQLWDLKLFEGPNESGDTNLRTFRDSLAFLRRALLNRHIEEELRVSNSVNATTIVALPAYGQLRMFVLHGEGNAEEYTDELAFACIGSGHLYASPFLAFLRRIFWKGLPTLEQGRLAAAWALDHTIKVNPGGVGGEVQMAVLYPSDTYVGVAVLVTPEELGEVRQAISAAEQGRRQLFEDPPPYEPMPTISTDNLPDLTLLSAEEIEEPEGPNTGGGSSGR